MASKTTQPVCEECDEEPVEFVCNECGAHLCSDCAEEHRCYRARIDELFDELFKSI